MKFGAGFWGPFPLGRYVEYAVTAERLGFDAIWIGDTQLLTPDLYSAMALCANATSRIQIGSGVTNTVTRDLTVTAGGFLALNEFSGGRCLLGVGVGGSAVGTVGLAADSAAEFRRKLALIKALAAGETVTLNGTEVRGKIRAPRVPVYAASSSPRVLQVAGELADGVILNVGVAPELIREALDHASHARPVPDEIARSFVFAGTAAEVTQTVRRLEACGVTQVLPLPMGSNITGTLEAWSREVMPAWRMPSLAGR